MEEEKNDFKNQGENLDGDGQPEKKPVSDEGVGEDENAPAEEMESISKRELETLKEKAENYRKAVIRLNREKGRTLGGEPELQPKPKDDVEDVYDVNGNVVKRPKTDDSVLKADLQRRDEKTAIAIACEDTETEDNWDDIVIYYEAKHGKNDVKAILTDLRAAKAEWKRRQPTAKPQDTHRKSSADLGTDSGTGKSKEKVSKPAERKHIFPQKSSMDTWYPRKS